MMSQPIKVQYIQCQKGGLHSGELINIVCLNPSCYYSPVCCCACIQQSHKGHHTKPLKKLINDADTISKQLLKNQKQAVKPNVLNMDILYNLIQQSLKQAMQKYQQIQHKIQKALDKIKESFFQYYDNLLTTLKNNQNKQKKLSMTQVLQKIQQATTLHGMIPHIQYILAQLQKNSLRQKQNETKQVSQEALLQLIQFSNMQVNGAIAQGHAQITNQLNKSAQILSDYASQAKKLWIKQIYQFSTQLKNDKIWLPQSNIAQSKKQGNYLVALMQPGLINNSQIKGFKFRIKKMISSWVAVGICQKKTMKQRKFLFNQNPGHGCYLISSNGGTWSSDNEDLNNKVKTFTFKQGDTITCIVNGQMKQIFFIKQASNEFASQKQIYELPYYQKSNDQLHPCVVFYFAGDQIECIPLLNLQNIPKYQYLFSDTLKHPNAKIISGRMAKGSTIQGYQPCLMNKSLQDGILQVKKFSFRIVRCSADWVGVGMCHAKTASKYNYEFRFDKDNHGYYMISSNGGSWSPIEKAKNNKIRTFKFKEGDIIECRVVFGKGHKDPNNIIVFRKGNETYELNFQRKSDDNLHPCVMLHYLNDQVNILPTF